VIKTNTYFLETDSFVVQKACSYNENISSSSSVIFCYRIFIW